MTIFNYELPKKNTFKPTNTKAIEQLVIDAVTETFTATIEGVLEMLETQSVFDTKTHLRKLLSKPKPTVVTLSTLTEYYDMLDNDLLEPGQVAYIIQDDSTWINTGKCTLETFPIGNKIF